MTIGNRIIEARTALGWKQKTLAEILEARGIMTQQTLSRLERGEAHGTTRIVEIAHVLGVRSDWLATGLGQMQSMDEESQGLALHHINDRLAALVSRLDGLDRAEPLPENFIKGLASLLDVIEQARANQTQSKAGVVVINE